VKGSKNPQTGHCYIGLGTEGLEDDIGKVYSLTDSFHHSQL